MKKWWVKSSDIKSNFNKSSVRIREKYSLVRFIYSFIGFIVFLFLYSITNWEDLTYLFGFAAVVLFAVSILFLISYLVAFFYRRMEQSRSQSKKAVKKSAPKKVSKEVTQKRATKKSTPKRSGRKPASKKTKTASKKRR